MIGYPEAVAIVGTSFAISLSVIKLLNNRHNRYCDQHEKLFGWLASEIASIKHILTELTIAVCNGKPELEELRERLITILMERKNKC